MRRQDYFAQGNRGWLHLHEKGGSGTTCRPTTGLPRLEAGELEEPKAALFQSVDPAVRRLSGRALEGRVVLAMIKRRAGSGGAPAFTCCHSFRATGIAAYLSNGGMLEHA